LHKKLHLVQLEGVSRFLEGTMAIGKKKKTVAKKVVRKKTAAKKVVKSKVVAKKPRKVVKRKVAPKMNVCTTCPIQAE